MPDEIKINRGKASRAQGGAFEKRKMGKKSKASGSAFELRVRKDLESKGFICDKWSNNVEFSEWIEQESNGKKFVDKENGKVEMRGKLVKAKAKWCGPNRPMMMGAGFPDFVCWHKDLNWEVEKRINGEKSNCVGTFAVESKMTGELDREEKEKCLWLLNQGIFSKILIAKKLKIKNRVSIEYSDFKEKYWRFLNEKN